MISTEAAGGQHVKAEREDLASRVEHTLLTLPDEVKQSLETKLKRAIIRYNFSFTKPYLARFAKSDFHFLISLNAHWFGMRYVSYKTTKVVLRHFDQR